MTAPIFEFELLPIERIGPWGGEKAPYLTWFALTDGLFKIHAGGESLVELSPEIVQHCGYENGHLDYTLATTVSFILSTTRPALTPLPPLFARLVPWWSHLEHLYWDAGREVRGRLHTRQADLLFKAQRWINERCPDFAYLQHPPSLAFFRLGDELHLHWDNTWHQLEGIPYYRAQRGSVSMPATQLESEYRSLAERFLDAMAARIQSIESGIAQPTTPVDVQSLWQQHRTWTKQYLSDLEEAPPTYSWEEQEEATRTVLTELLKAGVAAESPMWAAIGLA